MNTTYTVLLKDGTTGTVNANSIDGQDAAAFIGMSVRWLETSDIPRVRLGRRVHWLREDLEAYLRAHRTHGVSA